jgi:hypothetical protein
MGAIGNGSSLRNFIRAATLVAAASAAGSGAARAQDVAADYPGLASCREHLEIALELNRRIVDCIYSPRPKYACDDFWNVEYQFAQGYSIYRIVNPKFCHGEFCYTFLYNRRNKSIVFSMDAKSDIFQFHHGSFFPKSLEKIMNHRYKNPSAGVVFQGRGGALGVSIKNDVVVVDVPPP